ncbi:Neurofilament light polypeptide like [Heracleum sosnowskyi]|uniref:Neurofilament light polypeptide like n=1 Tax=Heracleum sosnowskyi TaxID=360622 RepID=A0AAD8J1S4_9APIA|nr:Neurofilament light polypeptide like [Heracleum sosnowskyi]
MKSVSAQVVSSEPVTLAKASKIISNFVSIDNGASHAVSVYLRRAALSFADLTQFHKDLKSSSSHSKSRKKHTQIISFDFEQDEPESKENERKVKESEGSLGIEVEKSEGKKKKKKRKGEEITDVSGESAERSGVSKKKRRKTEGN